MTYYVRTILNASFSFLVYSFFYGSYSHEKIIHFLNIYIFTPANKVGTKLSMLNKKNQLLKGSLIWHWNVCCGRTYQRHFCNILTNIYVEEKLVKHIHRAKAPSKLQLPKCNVVTTKPVSLDINFTEDWNVCMIHSILIWQAHTPVC